MGLTNKLTDAIHEVDVIIAGGMHGNPEMLCSHGLLFYCHDMKLTHFTLVRWHCCLRARREAGRG